MITVVILLTSFSVTLVAQVFSEQLSTEQVRTIKEYTLAPCEVVPFIILPVEPVGPRKPYVESLTAGVLPETEPRCNSPTNTFGANT